MAVPFSLVDRPSRPPSTTEGSGRSSLSGGTVRAGDMAAAALEASEASE